MRARVSQHHNAVRGNIAYRESAAAASSFSALLCVNNDTISTAVMLCSTLHQLDEGSEMRIALAMNGRPLITQSVHRVMTFIFHTARQALPTLITFQQADPVDFWTPHTTSYKYLPAWQLLRPISFPSADCFLIGVCMCTLCLWSAFNWELARQTCNISSLLYKCIEQFQNYR